jgi:hypothetical protein
MQKHEEAYTSDEATDEEDESGGEPESSDSSGSSSDGISSEEEEVYTEVEVTDDDETGKMSHILPNIRGCVGSLHSLSQIRMLITTEAIYLEPKVEENTDFVRKWEQEQWRHEMRSEEVFSSSEGDHDSDDEYYQDSDSDDSEGLAQAIERDEYDEDDNLEDFQVDKKGRVFQVNDDEADPSEFHKDDFVPGSGEIPYQDEYNEMMEDAMHDVLDERHMSPTSPERIHDYYHDKVLHPFIHPTSEVARGPLSQVTRCACVRVCVSAVRNAAAGCSSYLAADALRGDCCVVSRLLSLRVLI